MTDEHELARRHLTAAMEAMERAGDTLAVATVAQALSVVEERAYGRASAATLPPADPLPC